MFLDVGFDLAAQQHGFVACLDNLSITVRDERIVGPPRFTVVILALIVPGVRLGSPFPLLLCPFGSLKRGVIGRAQLFESVRVVFRMGLSQPEGISPAD